MNLRRVFNRRVCSIYACLVSFAIAAVFSTALVSSCMAADDAELSIQYKAQLKGIWYGELKDSVRAQSLLLTPGVFAPATMHQLNMRVADDAMSMAEVLFANGYLDAAITPYVETNRIPVCVSFHAQKGKRYTISTFTVVYTNIAEKVPQPQGDRLLKTGSPAVVSAVEEAEAELLRFLQERGFPYPKKICRTVTRDRTDKTVAVVCTIDPGRKAVLGEATVQGCVRVNPTYIRNRIRWIPGAKYNVKVLEDLEKKLLQSGLFMTAKVGVKAADQAGTADQPLPVQVSVAERPFRTVRAGVSYYTDEGFGGQASWENRNLLENAESLSFTLFGSEIGYGANGRFKRPDLVARDVDLCLDLESSRDNPDAYDSTKSRLAAMLEKGVDTKLMLSGGLAFEYDRVVQQDQSDEYDLVSVPLSAEWDYRNNEMDPFRGRMFLLSVTPYKDILSDTAFVKSEGEGNVYFRLMRSPQTVLALRAMLGSIADAAGDKVPADKRFYAGGGGTIRGYKYQSVGELENGDPVGGNSMAAVSAELRTRISSSLGAVLFTDGGTAYPGSSPDSDIPFLWGAGVGLRYFIGGLPLRFDVAVPLDRREDIDESFQFYFSLGQSF